MLNFMTCILFNISSGWEKMYLYILYFIIVFLTDLLCTGLCLNVMIQYIVIYVAWFFYIIMIYLLAICYGIDKKISKVICLVFLICAILIFGVVIIIYVGLEKLFGYVIILIDVFCKKALFAL